MNDPRTFEIYHFGSDFERTKGEQCITPGHQGLSEKSVFVLFCFVFVYKTESKFCVNHKYKLCKLVEEHVCTEWLRAKPLEWKSFGYTSRARKLLYTDDLGLALWWLNSEAHWEWMRDCTGSAAWQGLLGMSWQEKEWSWSYAVWPENKHQKTWWEQWHVLELFSLVRMWTQN